MSGKKRIQESEKDLQPNGWSNKTNHKYDDMDLAVYTNITPLGKGTFIGKLPLSIQENDQGSLKECMNYFYSYKNHANDFTASLHMRVSINGSCHIFDQQKETLLWYFEIFNQLPTLYWAFDQKSDVNKFKLVAPSKIINANWIIEAEAHNENMSHLFVDMLSKRLVGIGISEDIQIMNQKAIVGSASILGGLGLVFMCLAGVKCYLIYKKKSREVKETDPLIYAMP